MMLAIEITDETPMMIPSTVRAERIFDDRRVSSAAKKFSRACDRVMIAISQTSKRQWDRAVTHEPPDRSQRKGLLRNSEIIPGLPPSSEPMPEMACRCARAARQRIPEQCQSILPQDI